MRLFVISIVIFFSFEIFSQVDYSKCAQLLKKSSSLDRDGDRVFFPFELLTDGTIKKVEYKLSVSPSGQTLPIVVCPKPAKKSKKNCHNDPKVAFYKTDPKTGDISILMRSPFGERGGHERRGKPHDRFLRYSTKIVRDANGHIIRVEQRQLISQQGLRQLQKEHARRNQSGGTSKPFSHRHLTTFEFQVKNGVCVPVRATDSFLTTTEPWGPMAKRTHYHLQLCKDIDNLLNRMTPSMVHSKHFNENMKALFNRYVDTVNTPADWRLELHNHSVESLVMNSRRGDGDEFTQQGQGEKVSPFVVGSQILQDCYKRGLGSFIKDPEIWKEPSAGEKTSSGSQPAR